MKQHYVMPVGVDDFRRVREEYYYVDKNDFIRQLIRRPRSLPVLGAWSVVNYFANECQPEPYWVNMFGNAILQHLLREAGDEQVRDLYALLDGGTVKAQLVEGAIYDDVYKSSRALYSMLLNTGYLTVAEKAKSYAGARTAMRIPNLEIRLFFQE